MDVENKIILIIIYLLSQKICYPINLNKTTQTKEITIFLVLLIISYTIPELINSTMPLKNQNASFINLKTKKKKPLKIKLSNIQEKNPSKLYPMMISSNYLLKESKSSVSSYKQRMMRNKRIKKNWNSNDVHILVWILNKYAAFYTKKSVYTFDDQDWEFVSSLMPATSGKKCLFKFLSLKKFSLMEFKWSKEESILLETLAQKNEKKDWKKIAQELYLKKCSMKKVFRTAKQCREHWNCYVNPQIKKGSWAAKEDIKLLECVLQLNCLKKWSQVSKNVKGRTQNAVKNRYSLLVEKEKLQSEQQNQNTLINRILLRLLQEGSSQQFGVKSKQLESIQKMQHEIFQQSKNSSAQKRVNSPAHGNINYQSSKGLNENIWQIKTSNVILPTVVLNSPVYSMETCYPIAPSFNPYLFNYFYGNHYQIN